MANNDFNNLKQLKSAMDRAKSHTDDSITEFAGTIFGSLNEMVQYRDVTIAVSTWKATTDATMLAKGYKYYSDVAITNLHANDLVFTAFKTSMFDILSTAGFPLVLMCMTDMCAIMPNLFRLRLCLLESTWSLRISIPSKNRRK